MDLENTHTSTRNFNNKLRLLNAAFDFTPKNAKPSEIHNITRLYGLLICTRSYKRECTRTLNQFCRWWISSESLLQIKHSFVITVRYEVQFVHCNMRLTVPRVKEKKKLLNIGFLTRVRIPTDNIVVTSLACWQKGSKKLSKQQFYWYDRSLQLLLFIMFIVRIFEKIISQSRVISNNACKHL